MTVKPAQVIFFTPHPDDSESRSGGTVARWTREGRDVIYVVCTNGDKGSDDPTLKPGELAGIREEEQLAAAKILGVREVVFLRHPDQGLEDTPKFREEVVRLIRTYQPEIVVTLDPEQRYISHRDHRIAGQVILEAIIPSANQFSYPNLLEAGLPPHQVDEVLLCGAGELEYRSDITNTFDIKVAALRCHKSQVGHRTDMKERMREQAGILAKDEDYQLAEVFHRAEMDFLTFPR